MPREALTGTTSFEVAAPAARPPHRGTCSHEARCRRWNLWHAQISRLLIPLMPTIPFVVRSADVGSNCAMSGHAENAAGAVSLVVVPAVLSPAVASSDAVASPAASVPMANENTSIDTVSQINVPRDEPPNGESPSVVPLIEPALCQLKVPADAVKSHFIVFHLNVQGLSDANLVLFHTLLHELGRPTYVAVTKTFLYRTVESFCLSGYHLIKVGPA